MSQSKSVNIYFPLHFAGKKQALCFSVRVALSGSPGLGREGREGSPHAQLSELWILETGLSPTSPSVHWSLPSPAPPRPTLQPVPLPGSTHG